MWKPPTPVEQELWNAVVAGVHAVERMDRGAFEAAADRLTALPQTWVCRTLRSAAGLLAEELDAAAEQLRPLVAARADGIGTWLPGVDRQLLATLLSDPHPAPEADALRQRQPRHWLLLLAFLSELAGGGVGAFVDVAMAGDDRPRARPLTGLVPQHRTGR